MYQNKNFDPYELIAACPCGHAEVRNRIANAKVTCELPEFDYVSEQKF